jgi:hypothetical protein
MRAVGHPDFVYTPWSQERREAASRAARARLGLPAKNTPHVGFRLDRWIDKHHAKKAARDEWAAIVQGRMRERGVRLRERAALCAFRQHQRAAEKDALRVARAEGRALALASMRNTVSRRFDGKLPPVEVNEAREAHAIITSEVRQRTSLYGDNANEIIQETVLAVLEGRVAIGDIREAVKIQHQRQMRAAGKYGTTDRTVTLSIGGKVDGHMGLDAVI